MRIKNNSKQIRNQIRINLIRFCLVEPQPRATNFQFVGCEDGAKVGFDRKTPCSAQIRTSTEPHQPHPRGFASRWASHRNAMRSIAIAIAIRDRIRFEFAKQFVSNSMQIDGRFVGVLIGNRPISILNRGPQFFKLWGARRSKMTSNSANHHQNHRK